MQNGGMIDNLNPDKYGQRNLVKCAFSMIKRKYGDTLHSRKYYNQLKEIKIGIILHNMFLENVDRFSTEPYEHKFPLFATYVTEYSFK